MSGLTLHWLHDPKQTRPLYKCGNTDGIGVTGKGDVTCTDCLRLMGYLPHHVQLRRDWTVAAVGGDTDLGFTDWLEEKLGVGAPTPHTPPYMAGKNDGLFVFSDVHTLGCTLEVVPQATGNVELTIEYDGEGHFLTLHHLDRMDLVRALLHDFHYSPERGGPHDQD